VVEFVMRGHRSPLDNEWAGLYRAARSQSSELPRSEGPGALRDAFQWTLQLGRERVEIPDRTLTGPLRELAERVLAEGE
jgi:hypothetical protein